MTVVTVKLELDVNGDECGPNCDWMDRHAARPWCALFSRVCSVWIAGTDVHVMRCRSCELVIGDWAPRDEVAE
jgi:hypothetical protein